LKESVFRQANRAVAFELSDEEMAAVDDLNKKSAQPLGPPSCDRSIFLMSVPSLSWQFNHRF
jgi:diketogulonate reductase-like aldo/keto reductase